MSTRHLSSSFDRGDAYRQLREAAGLSRHTMAERLGVSTATVYCRETGKKSVSTEAMRAARDVLSEVMDERAGHIRAAIAEAFKR